jgi:hypothetical protein
VQTSTCEDKLAHVPEADALEHPLRIFEATEVHDLGFGAWSLGSWVWTRRVEGLGFKSFKYGV